ncbi:TetR/AcrR family transcriptional regulator [Streptosporangium saharense]|uniref:TetR/AcrR family transcriptional regulator n=1 Tax=Streptosporangium saharense TaxID=1706840 RepID=UPI003694B8E8
MAERGTAGLTVRDIAREARVADGVLYNHFEGKEELLALALHAHVRSVERDLGPLPAIPGENTVADNLHACLTYGLALHTSFLPAFAGLISQPEVLARFHALPNPLGEGRGLHTMLSDYLGAERDLGRLALTADPESAATMLVGACHELVLPHLLRGTPTPPKLPPAAAEPLITTLMNGLAPSS